VSNITLGSSRTLRSVWTDSSGDPVNPTVTLTIRDPSDTITTPVVANPDTGTFTSVVLFDEVGIWYYEWVGETAEGTTICEGSVCIVPSSVLVSS
jgi:hypothetical protein